MGSEKPVSRLSVDHVEAGELDDHDLKSHGISPDIIREAQLATEREHSMTAMQALKIYPKAVAWSLLLSSAIIMEGFDNNLMGSFFGFPAFNKKYGYLMSDGNYGLSAAWQAGIQNALSCGQIIGLFANGIISERFGYRKTLMGCLVATVGFVFILFFAPNKETLVVGEIFLGIPLGVYQTLTVTYASEVCPTSLRAYLTTYVNCCWVFGQLVSSGVLKALSTREDQWAYRIPFACQWAWPIPIFIGVFLAPESPWWLIRKDRHDDAIKSLRRLTSPGKGDFKPEETISMIIYTNEIEKQTTFGTSYKDCFKGVDLRRTEIACLTWAAQSLCGASLMAYSNVYYQRAGLSVADAYSMSLGQYGLGAVGTFISWFLMSYIGRRTLYVYGLALLAVTLFITGFMAVPKETTSLAWGVGSMLLVYTFIYDSTIGPVCYSIVAEIPSSRLRNKTVVLARNFYNMVNIITGIIVPYMLNVDEWDWKGKAGFFWGGFCIACLVWAFFRLPEPSGRTYAELDVLFEQKTKAREFSKVKTEHLAPMNIEKI